MIIYKVTNRINGKVYIGQTRNSLEARRNAHFQNVKNGEKTKFYDAIRKYTADNFTWEIIDYADNLDELNKKEQLWIKKLNSINSGYNMTKGGESNPMDVKEIALNHLNKVQSQEFREQASKKRREYIEKYGFSAEHRNKISNALKGNTNSKGIVLSEEHKQKLFEARDKAMSNFKHSEETKERIRKNAKENWSNKKKAIIQMDSEENLIQEFESLSQAEKWLRDNTKYEKASTTNIRYGIKRQSLIYGYKWNYK